MEAGSFQEWISTRFSNPVRRGDHQRFWDRFDLVYEGNHQDAFSRFLSKVPDRAQRHDLIRQLNRILGFDELFEGLPEDLSQADFFRIFKDPDDDSRRFGYFALDREAFMGGEATGEMLGVISRTVQLEDGVQGSARFGASGTLIRQEFLDATAARINELATAKVQTPKIRAVVDIETAGLGDQGPWQISVRRTDADGVERAYNILMDNPKMDIGIYGDGKKTYSSFQDFYRASTNNPGAVFVGEKEGLQEFVKAISGSDVIVAHNASFDMTQLAAAVRKFKLEDDAEYGVYAREFLDNHASTKIIDTRLYAQALMGKIIKASPGSNPFSNENILLQTSLIEDIEKRTRANWGTMSQEARDAFLGDYVTDGRKITGASNDIRAAIYGRISRGLHYGDIDTFFTNQLFEISEDVFRGGEGLTASPLQNKALIGAIRKSAAVTPVTVLDEVGVTSIELMAALSRTQASGSSSNYRSQLMNPSGFERWVDQTVDADGRLRFGARLNGGPEYARLQQQALAEGRPFAFLSDFERVASTLMGRASTNVGGRVGSLQDMIPGSLGGAVVSREDARVFKTAIALPLELLKEAERAGVISSNFTGTKPGTQAFRLSAFEYGTSGRRDVALIADVLEDDAASQRFMRFFSDLDTDKAASYGITDEMREEIISFIDSGDAKKYGVQVGTFGTSNETAAFARFLDDQGFGKDRTASMRFTSRLVSEEAQDGAPSLLRISPMMIDFSEKKKRRLRAYGKKTNLGGLASFDDEQMIADDLTRLGELQQAATEAQQDSTFWRAASAANKYPDSPAAKIYNRIDQLLPKIKDRRTAFGAIAAVAGFFAYRESRPDKEDQTFGFQGYEDEGYYQQYKKELGEPVPSGEITALSAPLDTAYVTDDLYQSRIGHHRMGSSGRYDHLYGG